MEYECQMSDRRRDDVIILRQNTHVAGEITVGLRSAETGVWDGILYISTFL
jgi:hypothetical protein